MSDIIVLFSGGKGQVILSHMNQTQNPWKIPQSTEVYLIIQEKAAKDQTLWDTSLWGIREDTGDDGVSLMPKGQVSIQEP